MQSFNLSSKERVVRLDQRLLLTSSHGLVMRFVFPLVSPKLSTKSTIQEIREHATLTAQSPLHVSVKNMQMVCRRALYHSTRVSSPISIPFLIKTKQAYHTKSEVLTENMASHSRNPVLLPDGIDPCALQSNLLVLNLFRTYTRP